MQIGRARTAPVARGQGHFETFAPPPARGALPRRWAWTGRTGRPRTFSVRRQPDAATRPCACGPCRAAKPCSDLKSAPRCSWPNWRPAAASIAADGFHENLFAPSCCRILTACAADDGPPGVPRRCLPNTVVHGARLERRLGMALQRRLWPEGQRPSRRRATVFERLDAPGQWFSRLGFIRKDCRQRHRDAQLDLSHRSRRCGPCLLSAPRR